MRIFVVATLAVLLASDAHAQNSMVFTEGMDATSIEAAMNEWTKETGIYIVPAAQRRLLFELGAQFHQLALSASLVRPSNINRSGSDRYSLPADSERIPFPFPYLGNAKTLQPIPYNSVSPANPERDDSEEKFMSRFWYQNRDDDSRYFWNSRGLYESTLEGISRRVFSKENITIFLDRYGTLQLRIQPVPPRDYHVAINGEAAGTMTEKALYKVPPGVASVSVTRSPAPACEWRGLIASGETIEVPCMF
jgi:hypothetical protein